MITLKRRTGWQGSASPMKIWLDGEKAADVMEKETKSIALKKDQALLKVSQTGMKSEEVLVQSGDVIRITMNPWHWVSLFIFIAGMLLPIWFLEGQTKFLVQTAFGIILVSSLFISKRFRLEVKGT